MERMLVTRSTPLAGSRFRALRELRSRLELRVRSRGGPSPVRLRVEDEGVSVVGAADAVGM